MLKKFPFWISDWQSSHARRRLSRPAMGLYLDLLAYLYASHEPGAAVVVSGGRSVHLSEDEILTDLLRPGETVDALRPAWAELIRWGCVERDDTGRWVNRKALEVSESEIRNSKVMKDRASKAAKKRWGSPMLGASESHAPSIGSAVPPPPTPEPSPDPGPPIPLDHDQEDDSPDGEAGPEPNEAGFDDPCKTPTPDELSVWEYWKRAWRNDDAKIDWGNRKDKRAKAIREALKLHSAADLMKCIRGYTHDTWRPRAEALSAHEPHVLFGEQLRFEQGIAFADIVDARERLGTRLRSPYATGRERWRN